MRRWLIALAALVALAGLASAAWWWLRPPDEPAVLSVAAGPRGSDGHTLMSEVAAVVERSSETLRLRVVSSPSSSRNVSLLQKGLVDLGTIEASSPPIEGLGFVADLFPDYFLLVARGERPLFRIADLPGKRIALPDYNTVEQKSFWAIVDHYGLSADAFRFYPQGTQAAIDAMLSDQVDAAFFLSSIRDPAILAFVVEANIRRVPLRFIEIDQAAAMALKRPFLTPATIVRGAFGGNPILPRGDVRTAALHRILAASDAADAAAVAELARVMFENRLDLLIRMPLSSAISGPAENGIALPLHEGARRFYDRDKPSFLQENAEPMAFIVTLATIFLSLLLALRRALVARQKNRADDHNQTLLVLSRRARSAQTHGELEAVRAELFALMEQVVEALDEDKVTEDGFRSFAAIWESVRSVTRDRRAELERALPASGRPPISASIAPETTT